MSDTRRTVEVSFDTKVRLRGDIYHDREIGPAVARLLQGFNTDHADWSTFRVDIKTDAELKAADV